MTESTNAGDGITDRPSGLNTRSFLRRVVYPVVVILAIAGIIWWIENRNDDAQAPSGAEYGAREINSAFVPSGYEVGTEEGQIAPDFELERVDGGEAWLTDFRGHPVVLNFWATWCQPCRQEMPQLVTAYDKDKANGLVIVGLNLQEGKDLITPFADRFGIDYPVLIDRDGDVGDEYDLLGLPTTYFIDANGVIQSVFRGPLEDTVQDTKGAIGDTELQQRIAAIMAIPVSATQEPVEAGKSVEPGPGLDRGGAAPSPHSTSWTRTLNLINPLRAVWWLFTNVRFAIVLLALVAAVSMVGVLVPQMPGTVKGDQALEQDWLTTQHDKFGFLTNTMHDVGLFEIFQQRWFGLLLAATVVSTGAYIVSRFPGIWANIRRPRRRVPDRYFDMAPARCQLEQAVDPDRLERAMRAKRYKVYRSEEAGATYLFADRFQYAQLGTLLTHAAIIVFILSAVVQRVDAYDSPLFLAEGSTLPVFAVSNPNQMQVTLDNAYARFAPDGQPLDYRADLIIYDRGTEAKRCSSTVNTPCTYNSYHFYQEAYFGYGATISVRDTATGNVVYQETLALAQKSPSPRVKVTGDDGSVLLNQTVVLTDTIDSGDAKYEAGLIELPGNRPLTFWLPESAEDSDKLVVFEPGTGDAARATLGSGETAQSGGLTISYLGLEAVPSAVADNLPLPKSAGGTSGSALFELSNVAFGTSRTSSGSYYDATGGSETGDPMLTIIGLPQAVTMKPGESKTIDGLEYKFERQAEFAGIDVRRDRSDSLIWIGAFAIVIGLAITFWVPRRRLWAKISEARTSLAGQAPSHANYSRDLRDLVREAGGSLPDEETDDDD